ncbi:hypothetical protein [Actinomadura coerulea]|uniref:hypothetical protein n=1 Tax=Actinomadura coerulea TaxID=46159 RepID=UPI003430A784
MNADDAPVADPGWARGLINTAVALLVSGRTYPSLLPAALAPWYCFTQDGGHCVAVVLKCHHRPGADPAGVLVPLPVKAVLRSGWTLADQGVVVCDLPYDPMLGPVTDPGDDEF